MTSTNSNGSDSDLSIKSDPFKDSKKIEEPSTAVAHTQSAPDSAAITSTNIRSQSEDIGPLSARSSFSSFRRTSLPRNNSVSLPSKIGDNAPPASDQDPSQESDEIAPLAFNDSFRRSSLSPSNTSSLLRKSSLSRPETVKLPQSKSRQRSVQIDPLAIHKSVIEEDTVAHHGIRQGSDQSDQITFAPFNEKSPTHPDRAVKFWDPSAQSSLSSNNEKPHRRQSSIKFDDPFTIADAETGLREKLRPDRYAPDPRIPTSRRKSSCVLSNSRKSIYSLAEEKVVRTEGKKRLKLSKFLFILFFLLANAGCIAIVWIFPKYWWAFCLVILLGNVLNSLMVLNIIRWFLWGRFLMLMGKGPAEPPTDIPTTIAMVLACYCESYDDLVGTLNSLSEQEKVDHHKKMFLIICDGQVKGKGTDKSTDRILVEDILKPEEEHFFPIGYESWDGAINGIYASSGVWKGTPFVCLVKKRNLGKRDGLILIRTLLYKYKYRHETPLTTVGDDFFRWFCEFSEDCGIESFEWLVGVDADTTFNKTCIYEMHKECLKDPKLLGCSGLIEVAWRTGNWNFWNLYQNAEYIRAQCLRRWHQAHGTGKVSCLPGACQIIKIVEETCGDELLIKLFGILPDPKADMIQQVRALAGEDRNYICLIFQEFSQAQTTMSLNAIAYTDPPNSLMVFLSQRKRWTLSTCANDVLITSKGKMNWFERICSGADIITWTLPIFVMQTLILFIKACMTTDDPTFIICFSIVTMIPLSYGLVVPLWACDNWRLRVQYWIGFVLIVLLGQFITPMVICYAIWHMDDFSWGKTREVEASDNANSKPAHSD